MFSHLDLLFSSTPLEGPEQMALDDVLLRHARRPLLRLYDWKAPCVTFGYFQKYRDIRAAFPAHPLVRRSSGGGAVEHGSDATFSLIIPAKEPLGKIAPPLFYQELHHAMVETLRSCKVEARLVQNHETMAGAACFAAPACGDVMLGSQKIVGGAQRRAAGSLLYQGSLQLMSLEKKNFASSPAESLSKIQPEPSLRCVPSFFEALAARLAAHVCSIEEQRPWLEEAASVACERYRTSAWTEKR